MKKLIVMSFAFCFGLSVAAFAQPDQKDIKKMEKERQEMTQLVEKYNKATSDKKKEEIKAKIAEKVAANYDKHIERMEERLNDSQKKLDEAREKLAQSKLPEYKAKHIDEITQGIISGEKKPMFGMPPNAKGDFPKDMKGMKGMKGQKGPHKGPFMKGNKGPKDCPCMKGEEKECPFAKDGNKDGKECPFAKNEKKDGKGCPCKDKMKAEKELPQVPEKPEAK